MNLTELRRYVIRRSVEKTADCVLAYAENNRLFVLDVLDAIDLPKGKDADVRNYLGVNGTPSN